jgi:hypothetical protein
MRDDHAYLESRITFADLWKNLETCSGAGEIPPHQQYDRPAQARTFSTIATGTIRINVTPRSVLDECLHAGSARKFELIDSHIGSFLAPLRPDLDLHHL